MKALLCVLASLFPLAAAQQPDRTAFEPICTAPLPGGEELRPRDARIVVQGQPYTPCTARLFRYAPGEDFNGDLERLYMSLALDRARLGVNDTSYIPLGVVQAPFLLDETDFVMRLSSKHHVFLFMLREHVDYVANEVTLVAALYPVLEPDRN